MKAITNIINPALTAIVLACFALSPVAQARPQPTPTAIDRKIARLRNEIIALDASLITHMSQAETSIGNDVELLHASIVAAQLETVDTKAAYREAKSLVRDLDTLRQHAIADLTLPSDYTPPNVPSTVLAGTSTDVTLPSDYTPPDVPSTALAVASTTDPETVLASTYKTSAKIISLMTAIDAATLDVQTQLAAIAANDEKNENISIAEMFEMQMLMNQLSQLSDMSTSIVSASNSAMASMARGLKG